MMLFSKSTNGFYDPDIHKVEQIPGDAVEVSAEDYAKLLQAQYLGKRITSNEEGCPVAIEPPPPTAEELAVMNKAAAAIALADSDITVLRCYENGVKVPADIVSYRKTLRSIVKGETTDTVPEKPKAPKGI